MDQVGFLSPSRGWLWIAVGALAMVFGVSPSSRAEIVNSIFPGDVGIVITLESPMIPSFEVPLDARVVPTLAARDPSGQLTKVSFAASAFQTTNLSIPLPSSAGPTVGGLQVTVRNGPANFTRVDGKFRGVMSLNGTERVCLGLPCASASFAITVPLNVVGGPGIPPDATVVAGDSLILTVKGAPWTQGAATLQEMTSMGAIGTQMVTGNFAEQTQTTMGETYRNVVTLVTPIFLSSSFGLLSVIPAYGLFRFTLTTPEPETAVAVGAAFLSLIAMGVARRR